ncbi:DEAD-box helicase Dbp80-like [Topomyia yanbarensis]|uniref:DEAD-box helicase Dbp80-like n=1 Tax=Topomyia yanbarensis TaxID=2498891 RepID=UPI00273C93AC|nr:DEAD-box helicase Dbp80-like [Topomyia yanbarensis]
MSQDGHSVAVLSGDLTVEERLAVSDRFQAGLEKLLIIMNVLSRGNDVEQVTIIVNFDLPMDQQGRAECETYLHRIRRTGRIESVTHSCEPIDYISRLFFSRMESPS